MKLRSMLYGTVLGAIIPTALSAMAQPVKLICIELKTAAEYQVTLDESNGMAAFSNQEMSRATFTAADVRWVPDYSRALKGEQYVLSRVTGKLHRSYEQGGNSQVDFYYDCKVLRPIF